MMTSQRRRINKCIYCGGTGETDEHVIPFALGGRLILRKASCERCRDITSRCERNPLKDNWESARAVLDYPSRKRKFAEESFMLDVTSLDGSHKVLTLDRSQAIGFAPFLEYPPPAFLVPRDYISGTHISGSTLIGFGPGVSEFRNRHQIKGLRYTVVHHGNQFEQMVARIAYCAAVFQWGLDCLEEVFVLPAILGTKDDTGYWMGCDPDGRFIPLIGRQNCKNVISFAIWEKPADANSYLLARVKFFAASEAPEYVVAVGRMKAAVSFEPISLQT